MSKSVNFDINKLRNIVISKMKFFIDISGHRIFSDDDLSTLSEIKVSYLSRNSISRHGLTTNLDKSKRMSNSNCVSCCVHRIQINKCSKVISSSICRYN